MQSTIIRFLKETVKLFAGGTKLAGIGVLLIVFFGGVSNASAFDPAYYDDEFFTGDNGGTFPFREIQIQLCTIGIWSIATSTNPNIAIYTGTLGAPRPTGTQIKDAYGAGTYYFYSNNSTGCTGLTDEPFGQTTWARFNVNFDGSISNAVGTTSLELSSPSGKTTRFLSASASTATSSGNLLLEVQYYLNPSEVNTSVSAQNPSQVKFQWSLGTSSSFTSRSFAIDSTTGTSSTQLEVNNADFPDNGYITGLLQFDNVACQLSVGACPFPDVYMYVNFTMSSGTVTGVTVTENYGTFNQPIEEQNCSFSDVSACIKSALVYTFFPSQSSIQQFSSLYTTMQTKFPFAYLTDFKDSITSIYTNPTTHSLAVTVPFGTFGDISLISASQLEAVPYASTIKTLIGAFIWFAFGAAMWERTRRIFDKETV